MAAGYLLGNVCYPLLADATAAYWSKAAGGITPGTTSYITQFEWSGTAWVVKRYTLSSGGTLTLNTTTTLPALSFPTCDTSSSFTDGMTIGWGVAAAIVGAWVIKNLRRGV